MRAASSVYGLTLAAMMVLGATPALAQTAPPSKAPANADTADKPPLKQEELDQLLAPVALYPDPVITQMLMASTYPLEIVEADRWLKDKDSANLKGDELAAALEKQSWDPSVKSLISFPDVLSMMSKELDWTVKLGDAFLEQQTAVMDTIQSLRSKAKDAGNLKSTPQQQVKVEQEAGGTEVIVIEPSSPQTIYVPQYNPTAVYGAWPYPAYPPYYYPTGAAIAGAAISFGVGMAMSAAWGYAWGHAGWGHGHGHVDVDVNRNSNFNRNINRESYRGSSTRSGTGRGNWQHDPSHRRGAAYSNRSTAQRYGGNRSASASQARDQFRGRAQQGRQDIAAGRVDRSRVNQATAAQRGSRPASTAGRGAGGTSRAAGTSRPASTSRAAGGSRGGGSFSSGATRGSGGNAFAGANRGSSTRAASSRGNMSRASSGGGGRSRSFSGGGGRSRGGGGGRRR